MKKLVILLLSLALVMSLTACSVVNIEEVLGEVEGKLGESGELSGILSELENALGALQTAEGETGTGEGMHGYEGNEGADLKNVTADNYTAIAKGLYGVTIQPESGWKLDKAESPNKVNNLNVSFTVTDGTDAKAVLKTFFTSTMEASDDGVYQQSINWDTFQVSKGEKYSDFDTFFNAEVTHSDTLCSGIWIYDYNGRSVQFSFSLMSGTLELGMVLLS